MGTAVKHPVPDRVKPSFVIFDIRALWSLALSVRVPGCQKLQMTVWHKMLYSCTHMATVGVKGLDWVYILQVTCLLMYDVIHSIFSCSGICGWRNDWGGGGVDSLCWHWKRYTHILYWGKGPPRFSNNDFGNLPYLSFESTEDQKIK